MLRRTKERIRNLDDKLAALKNMPDNEQGIDYYSEINRYRTTRFLLNKKLQNIQNNRPMLGNLEVPATSIGADKKFPFIYNN